MDYSFYYREELTLETSFPKWDLFISAFNLCDRVINVFNHVVAREKVWLLFPEYSFRDCDTAGLANTLDVAGKNESEQLVSILHQLDLSNYKNKKICIDSTGIMAPQLLILLMYFQNMGFDKVDFLYSEPISYSKQEHTEFTYGSISETRQVLGYAGVDDVSEERDLLIVATGYESGLLGKVAQYKEDSDIVQIFGFPSLKPDMYQHNVLSSILAADSFEGSNEKDPLFAPSADPFETAAVIKRYIERNDCLQKYRHIYFSPLSTKPQCLGMGLTYLNDYKNSTVSIIYPFTQRHGKKTSTGLSKTWLYTVEF